MRSVSTEVLRHPSALASEARARQLEQVFEQIGEAVIVKDLDAVVT
jgi:hypothetical protein